MPFPDPILQISGFQSGLTSRTNPIVSNYGQINGRINSVTGFAKKAANLLGGKKTSDQNKHSMALETFQRAQDPLFDVDWLAIVMDRSNPAGVLDWYYINAIQTPSLQIGTNPVFRAGKMSNYADVLSVADINVSFFTDAQSKTLKFASSWFSSVYDNESGNYRLPREYKKDVYLYMLDPAMKEIALFKFLGCFPTSWNSYTLKGGQASLLTTTMDLAVDSFSIGEPDVALAQVTALASG